ncbi:MAG: formate/nitrite transporter family protein [Mahellales bacterium]|jgi:formate/nitrite transporter
MERSFISPPDIPQELVNAGCKKVSQTPGKLVLLGILAGAFIAFAAQGSNAAVHTINSVGIAKTLAGALFASGLIMVIVAGAELFTGNSLIIISCLEGRTRLKGLFKNWAFVYMGNFIGSIIIAFFILQSGQLGLSGGMLGGFTIKTAVFKTSLTFGSAFFSGILCNWLVCLAVWMASAAKDIQGKILAIFFPIWLFVTSGFEHSIANMYYISAGLLAKSNAQWVEAAYKMGVAKDKLDGLTWGTFFTKNLIPVTLGNIIGGVIFVGTMYWIIYLKKDKGVKTANYEGLSKKQL